MKCDNWIDPTRVGKRGQFLKSAYLGTFEARSDLIRQDRPHAEKCGGKIIASVRATDEPYYGGTSATLEINYKCERCKEPLFGNGLPHENDQVADILTAHVAAIPQRKGRQEQN